MPAPAPPIELPIENGAVLHAKSLADLKQQYEEVDNQVERQIRTLRTGRTRSFEDLFSWLVKTKGAQQRDRQR